MYTFFWYSFNNCVIPKLLTIILVWKNANWSTLVLAIHLIGVGVGTLISGLLAYQATRPWTWRLTLGQFKYLYRSSLVYGYFFILINIANRSDALIIKYFRGDLETGLFGAAKQLFDYAIIFFSLLITEALFPVISELHRTAPEMLRVVYRQVMRVSFLVITPISLFIIFYSLPITNLLYGVEYMGSAAALTLLAIGMVPANWHTIQVRFLFSTKHERDVLAPVTIRLLLCLVLYGVSAYLWGYEGVAISLVIALSVECIWYCCRVSKFLGCWSPGELLLRPLIANIILAIVFIWSQNLPLILAVLLAAILYPILLVTTKSLDLGELKTFLRTSPTPMKKDP